MLNNSSNLYGSEWLALVFNNRNQNYGAYVLRTQSSNILLRSLMIVAPFFIMLFVGPVIYGQLKGKDVVVHRQETVIDIADAPIHKMEKEQPKKEQPVKEEAAPLKKQAPVEATKFTANIKIVEDTNEDPPTLVQLQNTVIASENQEGIAGKTNAVPASDIVGGHGTATDGGVDPNIIYNTGGVEVYPEFPGGMEAWAKFIQKNLRYPYAAQDQEIQGKVYLSFVVERDGSITDVRVVKGIGYGCDEEAARVIKKSPKWKAGMQNQQSVRVRYNMPINYMLSQ